MRTFLSSLMAVVLVVSMAVSATAGTVFFSDDFDNYVPPAGTLSGATSDSGHVWMGPTFGVDGTLNAGVGQSHTAADGSPDGIGGTSDGVGVFSNNVFFDNFVDFPAVTVAAAPLGMRLSVDMVMEFATQDATGVSIGLHDPANAKFLNVAWNRSTGTFGLHTESPSLGYGANFLISANTSNPDAAGQTQPGRS